MNPQTQIHESLEFLLTRKGLTHQQILEWIISNYLSENQAINALQLLEMEISDLDHDNIFYDYGEDVNLED